MKSVEPQTPPPTYPRPAVTPTRVLITLLLLVAACCTVGLFMVTPGTKPFWVVLAGLVIAGAGAMAVPLKDR